MLKTNECNRSLNSEDEGKILESSGSGKVKVLLVGTDYAVIDRDSKFQPYITVYSPSMYQGKLIWMQGHYYEHKRDAIKYFTDNDRSMTMGI